MRDMKAREYEIRGTPGPIDDFALEGRYGSDWPPEATAVATFLAHPQIAEARVGLVWDESAYVDALLELANSGSLSSPIWRDLLRGRSEPRGQGPSDPTVAATLGLEHGAWHRFALPGDARERLVADLDLIAQNWNHASTQLGPIVARTLNAQPLGTPAGTDEDRGEWLQARTERLAREARQGIVLLPHFMLTKAGVRRVERIAAASPAAILNYVLMLLLARNSELGPLVARCRHCAEFFIARREKTNRRGTRIRRWCKKCEVVGKREWERKRKEAQRDRERKARLLRKG